MNEDRGPDDPSTGTSAGDSSSGMWRKDTAVAVRRGDVSFLPEVVSWLKASAGELAVPLPILRELDFCVSELLANIAFYAFDDETSHDVYLEIARSDDRVSLSIVDDGRAFDPGADTQYTEPHSLDGAGHRGYGVHLVRRLTDAIHYKRVDGRNILTLEKRLHE